MTDNTHGRPNSATLLPLVILSLVYIGLLAGDQPLPLLSNSSGSPEVRTITALTIGTLLPRLLTTATSRDVNQSLVYLFALVTFFGYMALTTLWSPPGARPETVLVDAIFLLFYVGLGIAAALRLDPESWRLFWLTVVCISVSFAVLGFLNGVDNQGRMAALGGGPNVFVRIVGVGVLVCALFAFKTMQLRWIAPGLILTVAAVLSGSRGGMLALAACLLLTMAIGHKWIRGGHRSPVFLAGLVVMALALLATLGDTLAQVLRTRFGQQLLTEGQTAGRENLYSAGLELWSESFIVGNGIGAFAVSYGRGFSYTHNIVLDILVDGGIVGVLFFVLTLTTARLRYSSVGFNAAIALTAGVFYLLASQFSGTYYDTRFIWFFLGLACVACARSSGARPSKALNDRH